MNKVILRGRLTRDPETRTTQNGKSWCRFCVAVDRRGKDAGADFINCVAWDKTADLVAKWWTKGKGILLEGCLRVHKYESNGQNRTASEVVVQSVEFCGSKNSSQGQTGNYSNQGTSVDDEEVPF